jgi:CheY-like chemotaxis protein
LINKANSIQQQKGILSQKDDYNILKLLPLSNYEGPKIMIVDDVFFNIDILKDVMRQVLKINVNENVVEASDGKQALKQYIKLTKKYDNICPIELILMDCDMPVMNGFKATEMILKYAQIAID